MTNKKLVTARRVKHHKTARITIQVTPQWKRRIFAAAQRRGDCVSKMIVEMIKRELK